MILIGFGHRARQGKNTAAIAMVNAVPVDMEIRMYAYADELRAEVTHEVNLAGGLEALIKHGLPSGVCGCGDSIEHHSDPLNAGHAPVEQFMPFPSWVKPEDGKPRTLLQWWGTEYRRAQDPDYWVKRLEERIRRDAPGVALITDVRFPNEVEAIHRMGGYAVKVTRTSAPDINVPDHASEAALDGYAGWDYELKAATLAELKEQAAALFQKIAGRT